MVLLRDVLTRFGVDTSFVKLSSLPSWEAAIRPQTRMLFLETPSNPTTEIADLKCLARLAHAHDALLVVDNCFCTPVLQRPLEHGADLVIHSATKYLDGQGRCVGGAVVGPKELLEQKVLFFPARRRTEHEPLQRLGFSKGPGDPVPAYAGAQ